MAISFNRKASSNTCKYVKSDRAYLAEIDLAQSSYTIAAYVRLDSKKESKITQGVEEYEEKDDSNGTVVFDDTISSVTIEGTFLSRDEKIRQLYMETGTQSMKDRYFALVLCGASLVTSAGVAKVETWTFPKVRLARAFDYGIGGEGKYSFKFVALKNDTGAALTVALPTGDAAFTGDITTSSQSVGIDEFYVTADL